MAYLKWVDALSVGVDLIDSQHKQMISFVNELIDSLRDGKAEREIDRAVEFLEDYAYKHFAAEQELMTKFAYPALVTHIRQHDSFRKELGIVKRELEAGVPPGMLLMRVKKSLADWFANHINDIDRSLGRFVRVRQEAEAAAETKEPVVQDAPKEPEMRGAPKEPEKQEEPGT